MRRRALAASLALAATIAGAAPGWAAPPAGFTPQDKADTVCMLVVGSIIATLDDGATADEREGLTSVLTYFIGKLKGRHPELKMTDILAPAYVATLEGDLAPAMQRCSEEAIRMGDDLNAAGDALSRMERAAPSS